MDIEAENAESLAAEHQGAEERVTEGHENTLKLVRR